MIIRFHFGSDASVTDLGWYLDDVRVTTPQSTVPLFRHTTRLPATADTVGPYVVTTEITDDGLITGAWLYYRSTGQFTVSPLRLVSGITYAGAIPGHPTGSTVSYFLRARDDVGNVATDPADAPDGLYSFEVRDRPQQLGPVPEFLFFTGEEGGSLSDTLMISNLGLLPLAFSLTDSCVGEIHEGFHEIITDSAGDVSPSCPDVVGLRAGPAGDLLRFEVCFASRRPETTFALISLDVDQDPTTGSSPPGFGLGSPDHDVGSEVELLVDGPNVFGSQFGIPFPSAIALAGGTLLCVSPLTIGETEISFEMPSSLLDDDGNMNVALLAFSDHVTASEVDWAPRRGHGTIGRCGPALWLSTSPGAGSVPAESSVPLAITVDARFLEPGAYEALIFLATDDPTRPLVTIPVSFHVAALSSPPGELPTRLVLRAAPNPFDRAVTLSFGLPEPTRARLVLFDLAGRRVRTLVEGGFPAGWHRALWGGDDDHGRRVAWGPYVGRLVTGRGSVTVRLVKRP